MQAAIQNSKKINNLEIFRGICALLVVAWHFIAHIPYKDGKDLYPAAYPYVSAIADVFLKLSTYAVLGFFVISGFVITKSVATRIYKNNAFGLYLINRFLRLAMLCAPVTLISVALSYYYRHAHHVTNMWDKYSDFSLTTIGKSAIGFSSQWNSPGWTLVYEWMFYLLIIVPFMLLKPSVKNLVFTSLILVFTMGFMRDAVAMQINAGFLFGIAALFVHMHVKAIGLRERLIILGVSIVLIAWQIASGPNGYDNVIYRTLPVFGIGIFCLYEREYASWFYKVLSYFGKISFSIFIWHWPVFFFGNWFHDNHNWARNLNDILYMVVFLLPLAFVVAHFSYIYLERNARLEKMPGLYRLYLKYSGTKAEKVNTPTSW